MQIKLDIINWKQAQINHIQACAVILLGQNSVTYKNISALDGVIEIDEPSGDVSFLTEQAILDCYASEQKKRDDAQAVLEAAKVDTLAKIEALDVEEVVKTQLKSLFNG